MPVRCEVPTTRIISAALLPSVESTKCSMELLSLASNSKRYTCILQLYSCSSDLDPAKHIFDQRSMLQQAELSKHMMHAISKLYLRSMLSPRM